MNFNNIYLNSNDVINRIENVINKTESPITSIRLIAVDKLYQLVKKKVTVLYLRVLVVMRHLVDMNIIIFNI